MKQRLRALRTTFAGSTGPNGGDRSRIIRRCCGQGDTQNQVSPADKKVTMPSRSGFSCLVVRLLAAGAAIAVLAPAPVSAALPGAKGEGPLSPSLEALAAPSLANRPPAVQADRLGVPLEGAGSLVHEDGR